MFCDEELKNLHDRERKKVKINQDRIKANFIELVKLNSPAKKEKIVADWLRAKFAQLGLTVRKIKACL